MSRTRVLRTWLVAAAQHKRTRQRSHRIDRNGSGTTSGLHLRLLDTTISLRRHRDDLIDVDQ